MNTQYSEEDIQKAIRYIKTNCPDIEATREQAIKLLDTMQELAEVFVEEGEKIIKQQIKKKN